jgi:hypothetical protein
MVMPCPQRRYTVGLDVKANYQAALAKFHSKRQAYIAETNDNDATIF